MTASDTIWGGGRCCTWHLCTVRLHASFRGTCRRDCEAPAGDRRGGGREGGGRGSACTTSFELCRTSQTLPIQPQRARVSRGGDSDASRHCHAHFLGNRHRLHVLGSRASEILGDLLLDPRRAFTTVGSVSCISHCLGVWKPRIIGLSIRRISTPDL